LEQKKVSSLEIRLNECYREMDQEKRQKIELARENADLRANARRKETVLSDFELKVSNVQQNATSVNYENDGLRQEIKRFNDACNAKLKEMGEKYKKEVQDLNDEIDELRSKLKEKDIDNEAKIRGVSRELEAKVRSLENQLREKDRIISESESELKSLKEFNMKTKMEFEEEVRRQINIVRDDERTKSESIIKGLEAQIKDLEMSGDLVSGREPELVQEIKNKEKMLKDIRARFEDQIGSLKKENIDLKDQISISTSEIERLQGDLRGKDSIIAKLQTEMQSIRDEISRNKDISTQEINRLVGKNEGDIKRFQEYERQLKARIAELERMLKASQADTSKAKNDLERLKQQVTGNIDRTITQTFVDYGAKGAPGKFGY